MKRAKKTKDVKITKSVDCFDLGYKGGTVYYWPMIEIGNAKVPSRNIKIAGRVTRSKKVAEKELTILSEMADAYKERLCK